MAKPGGGMNMYNNRQGNNSFRRDNRNNNHQQNQGGQNKRTHSGNYSGPNNQQNQSRQQNNQNSNNKQVNNRASLEKPSPVKPAREGAPPSKAVKKEEAPPLAPAVAIVAEPVPVVEEAEVEASEVKVEPTKINEVANALTSGKKFTGRCRLFVGNITQDCNEVEFRKLFEPYGEVSEVYVNSSRGFGFIRLDYRHNAEAAKAALDGYQRKGRVLRIRFATHGAALKVKNLHTYVSNELLEQGFSQFGELERCVVIVDDKGKSTGEGIVEFVRKPGASSALRRITDGVFLLGADPKPIQVEPLEQKDEEDGQPEKFLSRTEQYKKEREKEPRFAPPGTFEFEFGMRWKQLEDLENKRIEQIKKDTEDARHKLEDEMQNALYEYQADQIRQDLLRQQEELRRLEELRNADRMRRQEEQERRAFHDIHRREQTDRQGEERRRADLMMTLRQQDIASRRGPIDEGDMRRREEMMMADRFADRMGDRGMPERGMQERGMQERGMQERGMQERMSERDMDRMRDMQNQNFMRGEGGMRGGDNQRGGRDMRDSGAPPLQPPPIPPTMNRGGPAGAAAAIAAKGSPGPKPLFPPGGPNGGPMDYISDSETLSCNTAEVDPAESASDASLSLRLSSETDNKYPSMETDIQPCDVDERECTHQKSQSQNSLQNSLSQNSLHRDSTNLSDQSETDYEIGSSQDSNMCDSYLGKHQGYRTNLYKTANESPTTHASPHGCRSQSEENNCSNDKNESVFISRAQSAEIGLNSTDKSEDCDRDKIERPYNKSDNVNYHDRFSSQSAYNEDYSSEHNSYSHSSSKPDNVDNNKCATQRYYSSENMIGENSADSYETARSSSHDNVPNTGDSYKSVQACKNNEPEDDRLSQPQNYKKEDNQNSYSTSPRLNHESHDCNSKDKTNESQYRQREAEKSETRDSSAYQQPSNEEFDERSHYNSTPIALPDVYQSYEEDTISSHVDNVNFSSAVVSDQPPQTDSSTFTSTQTATVIDTSTVSSLGEGSSTTFVESHSHMDEDNDAAFTTGDQSFKTAAARKSALVPFMQNSFAGTPVMQGMNQPGMMSSSTMHFARGGATIMKQQSLSTAGGMAAQATVMQQHALPNGMRATSVLQQRTLPNGQTVMVQQRTMTTGMGALAQQTVVQQHVNPMAQSLQARQQAAMTQGLMQQRAVRMAQARVLGAPMLQAQRMGQAFIQQRNSNLVGAGLVRGSGPSVMQQLVRQRYLGGPVMPGRGMTLVAGRPIRVKMAYPRENMSMENS